MNFVISLYFLCSEGCLLETTRDLANLNLVIFEEIHIHLALGTYRPLEKLLYIKIYRIFSGCRLSQA